MNVAGYMVRGVHGDVSSPLRAIFLAGLMLLSIALLPGVSALDTDGDGIEDPLDDCPVAAGNSTVDRSGCPDRDGDGTSDKNDPWTIQNGGFLQEAHQSSSSDYLAVFFNHNGSEYLTGDENGWLRIWNTAARQNLRSVQLSGIFDVGWSPDGEYVAAVTDGDELKTYFSSNLTPLFTVSTDVGSGDQPNELEFSPDGTMIAVVIGRSGSSSTNGEVKIYNSMNGSVIHNFNPASADRFYSVDWSPDSSRILIGGREDVWIYNVGGSWSANHSFNTNRGVINSVAWSPDGNSFVICEAWEGSGARVRMFDIASSQEIWVYSTSTSCLDLAWSPDSTQVAASMTYYQSDGASVRIFDANSGNIVDTASGPRPGGCTSGGGGNNCGSIYGVDWHPNGLYIIGAMGRNDEGIFHWMVDPDIDGDGVLNEDDAFPEDVTQWDDTDNDGYGDNPAPANNADDCPNTYGTSTEDRLGCPDADGDGWSDDGDAFPNDEYQWADADGDGFPDNTDDDRDPNPYGSVDWLPLNPNQWADSDEDGYGDNFANASWVGIRPAEWPGVLITSMTLEQLDDIDTFPLNPDQWHDTDGDWLGDEPFTTTTDHCPLVWGNSIWDRRGCPDSDGDGYSDAGNAGEGEGLASPDGDADAFPDNPTQWWDSDGDGYGDNSSGTEGDNCPGQAGTSRLAIEWDFLLEIYNDVAWYGCEDNDGDDYANSGEAFPNDPTQWADTDGDGYNRNSFVSSCGDNPEGNNPDLFPLDGTQCEDRDGDGYGDFPSGPNGDWFPDDPTQWRDTDSDGYGDNASGTNADICPFLHGTITTPEALGCPDSDNDGVPDPQDAFPDDPFQTTDTDGDGYGDSPITSDSDDCVEEYGTSNMGNIFGCPDTDGDGWADSIDVFPEDPEQWADADEDGCGDNYVWMLKQFEDPDEDRNGSLIELRVENGDAFPNDSTQCNDQDGDGWGDNESGNLPDFFPLRASQWKDGDRDGYGDNGTMFAYKGDACKSDFGTSTEDKYGCPDTDGDGWSDLADFCPYDPDIHLQGQPCKITAPTGKSGDGGGISPMVLAIGALITIVAFMLVLIFVAMIAKQSAGRRRMVEIREMRDQDEIFSQDEEDRRQLWVEHFLAEGDLEKAKELGWVDKADWQIHMEKKDAEEASLPSFDDLF